MAEVSFRRRKADECIRAASLALEHGYWETAVVRAYYCLFHTLIMIMARFHETEPLRGWKHESLRDRFERRFCRLSRYFNRRDGEDLDEVLKARMNADYHDVLFDEKRARRVVARASSLYLKASEVLNA